MFQFIPVRRWRAAALILLNAGGALPAAAETPLRFRLAGGHAVVVPVHVNGRGPFDFLLDTGASSSILHEGLAAELGLAALDRVMLVSVTGAYPVPRSRIAALTFGPYAIADLEALISPLSEVRRVDARIRGVLGYGALSGLAFGLDYRRRCVRFGAEGRRGERIPGEIEDGRIVLTARGGGRGLPLRVVPDSGLPLPILFRKRDRPLDVALTGSLATAQTDGGAAVLALARLSALRLGGTTLADVAVAVLGGEAAEARSEDGLLPTRLFASVFFEAGGASVWVEKR